MLSNLGSRNVYIEKILPPIFAMHLHAFIVAFLRLIDFQLVYAKKFRHVHRKAITVYRRQVNFKPVEAAPHTLSVRFNGQAVPGSPFACAVSAPAAAPDARASGPGLVSAPRGEPAEINLTGFHSKCVFFGGQTSRRVA